jgi:hypothetical protein
MKFDNPDKTHLKFQNYVLFSFGKLAQTDEDGNDTAIVKAVAKWGKIPVEQARSFIQPGTNPLIVLDNMSAKENIIEFPLKIFVPPSMVEAFERDDKSATAKTNRGKNVPRIGLFLLEAIIGGSLSKFSADDKDRDMGSINKRIGAFEKDVYGGIKDRIFGF